MYVCSRLHRCPHMIHRHSWVRDHETLPIFSPIDPLLIHTGKGRQARANNMADFLVSATDASSIDLEAVDGGLVHDEMPMRGGGPIGKCLLRVDQRVEQHQALEIRRVNLPRRKHTFEAT